jgi:hypothetical protein
MIELECFHCRTRWPLASASSNRCPQCGWVTEVYYDHDDAEKISETYNSLSPELPEPSGVLPLVGLEAFSVSFPEQSRIADAVFKVLEGA